MLNQQKFENASCREEQLALMIEELKKKRRAHWIVLIMGSILATRAIPTLAQYSESSYTGGGTYLFVYAVILYVVLFAVLFVVAKKKAKKFEAELDEQTTDEEKLLYK